ncbi:PepSY-associated TM helix domain-containing protein [uncultured Proteiniphilum sp.]|uniref:PepSY-associated TM helix domain-containing protein n=1 Tax=uncultured Proteiniphilum sp. TaxID=497637 RepID=UPI002627C219|nr:PepSY-associated TM helix domain-containing protein [uncultured Proteiniphilum sp.]
MRKFTINPKVRKWIRIIHRDLGFVMVGLSLVYGISGILLNHLDGKDPSYRIENESLTFAEGLTPEKFKQIWESESDRPKLNNIGETAGKYRLMIQGGIGEYDPRTGMVQYQTSKRKPFAYWVNRLHYNRVKGWSPVADIFAGALIFLAVSGLFMVKGKHSIAKRGKWYLIIGLLIPILYILLAG